MNSISTGIYTNTATQSQGIKLDNATRIIPSAEAIIDTANPRNEEEAAHFASMYERMEESVKRNKESLSNFTIEKQYERFERWTSAPVHAVIEKDGEVVAAFSDDGTARTNNADGSLLENNSVEERIEAFKKKYGDDITVHTYNDFDAPTWGDIHEQITGEKPLFTVSDMSETKSLTNALESMLTNYYERVAQLNPDSGSILDIEA